MGAYSKLVQSKLQVSRTKKFLDKTSQIAEEILLIMIDTKPKKQSFKETKLSVSVSSVDIAKNREISIWRLIDQGSFSATR